MTAFLRSCGYALRGIWFAAHAQRNFRIQLLAAAVALIAGVRLHLGVEEMAILGITVTVVIAAELFNTALEYLLNVLEARDHPIVRTAKDVAAGGTLAAVIGSVGVGLLLFGPRLWAILRRMG